MPLCWGSYIHLMLFKAEGWGRWEDFWELIFHTQSATAGCSLYLPTMANLLFLPVLVALGYVLTKLLRIGKHLSRLI